MSELNIRGYRSADLEALFTLDTLCFEERFRFSQSAMRRFAEADNAQINVGEISGELAGFCIVHLEQVQAETTGYVITLDVAPAHRCRGVAHVLLHAAEQQAKLAGCSAMLLHVYTGNAAAIRLYEREGYSATGMQRHFYGERRHALTYKKSLENTVSRLID